ncbi:Short-chain dehydrogenase/reductase SDR [Penicillium cf. griseofulvum]|uniref:Short-chain dehydrogenase/reductase SDR n=1 Tax=Penicillium cf. griseofulvum TaxID=2972120 RepID=A0A9W9MZ13_9EURO|nr:Short-chain dehydrogenase/reductase SDR [Penicillium cf. griseofulvum]KAJ5421552.1 Short-chain dehydrogenase/reductase SDR [Penicillium cf. griseofulvum]KAJ5424788.1 Short-chain dehydrogenase/reductase SDR [Penicillium cf. griseofulvum]
MSTILISGANKGIGRALVSKYLARDNVTVIAAVRNPSSSEATLSDLPTGQGSRLIIVKIDASSDTDAKTAVESLSSQRVSALDIVIANAGVFDRAAFTTVAESTIDQIKSHHDVNTLGPIRLFQATLPLLQKSSSPRFILISTLMATIGDMKDAPWSTAPYGASKAAANFFVRKINFEHDDIATLAIDPGSVKTESGNDAGRKLGFDGAFVEIEDSVNAIVAKIDGLTKENGAGEFWSIDNTTHAW